MKEESKFSSLQKVNELLTQRNKGIIGRQESFERIAELIKKENGLIFEIDFDQNQKKWLILNDYLKFDNLNGVYVSESLMELFIECGKILFDSAEKQIKYYSDYNVNTLIMKFIENDIFFINRITAEQLNISLVGKIVDFIYNINQKELEKIFGGFNGKSNFIQYIRKDQAIFYRLYCISNKFIKYLRYPEDKETIINTYHNESGREFLKKLSSEIIYNKDMLSVIIKNRNISFLSDLNETRINVIYEALEDIGDSPIGSINKDSEIAKYLIADKDMFVKFVNLRGDFLNILELNSKEEYLKGINWFDLSKKYQLGTCIRYIPSKTFNKMLKYMIKKEKADFAHKLLGTTSEHLLSVIYKYNKKIDEELLLEVIKNAILYKASSFKLIPKERLTFNIIKVAIESNIRCMLYVPLNFKRYNDIYVETFFNLHDTNNVDSVDETINKILFLSTKSIFEEIKSQYKNGRQMNEKVLEYFNILKRMYEN